MPSAKLLKSARDYQRSFYKHGLMVKLVKKLTVLHYRFWSVITGTGMPINCQVGGITIGKHAFIGVNAVVVKDVPAYAIVAGVSAKIIGTTAEGPEVVCSEF